MATGRDRTARAYAVEALFLSLEGALQSFRAEKEDDSAPHGRDVIVEIPLRMCRACRRTTRRVEVSRPFRALKWVFAVAGLAALLFWNSWLFALVILAAWMWLGEAAVARRRGNTLVAMLRQVPVYAPLLEEYPDARLVVHK